MLAAAKPDAAPQAPAAGLLRTISTEDDANRVYDPVRVIAVSGAVMFFGLTIWTVMVQGHEFQYLGFGAGFGALLTALGAALYMKSKGDA